VFHEREKNRTRSHIRSRVEHVFAMIKLKFDHSELIVRAKKASQPRWPQFYLGIQIFHMTH